MAVNNDVVLVIDEEEELEEETTKEELLIQLHTLYDTVNLLEDKVNTQRKLLQIYQEREEMYLQMIGSIKKPTVFSLIKSWFTTK